MLFKDFINVILTKEANKGAITFVVDWFLDPYRRIMEVSTALVCDVQNSTKQEV